MDFKPPVQKKQNKVSIKALGEQEPFAGFNIGKCPQSRAAIYISQGYTVFFLTFRQCSEPVWLFSAGCSSAWTPPCAHYCSPLASKNIMDNN